MEQKTLEQLEAGRQKKSIVIFDTDRNELESLARSVFEEFQTYEISGFESLFDFQSELLDLRPSIVIIILPATNVDPLVSWMTDFSANPQFSRVQKIFISNRKEFKDLEAVIAKCQFRYVPKPIRTSYLFDVISECIKKLNSLKVDLKSVPKGKVIFEKGETSKHLYILKEGLLEAYNDDLKLGEITEGQAFGELAFLTNDVRGATIKAALDSKIYELSLEEYDSYLQEQPFWLSVLIDSLAVRLKKANERIISNQ